MSDRWDDDKPQDTTEGVRIIGAEEAAEALERGDVAPRRGEGELRYGDRPASPPEDVQPAIRFPLPADEQPDRIRPRTSPAPSLPHWTDPPTGEVPRIRPEAAEPDDLDALAAEGEGADDLEAWSSFATSGPRWRDSAGDWAEPDYDPEAMRHDESTRVGALDESDRPAPDDFFFDAPAYEEERPRPVIRTGVRTQSAPPAPATGGGDRDMPMAIGVGVGLVALFLLLLSMGPGAAMFLVAGVLVLAAAELFAALHKAGYAPATLLGLVAVGGLAGAAYWKGETAIPLVLALAGVFSLLWYLVGVTRTAPTMNAAVTVFGVVYVGLLGSFAALMLRWPDDHGTGILLGTVIAVVINDVAALVVGRQAGRAPLAPNISPNKTIEGTVGGGLATVIVVTLAFGPLGLLGPWDTGSALALGVLVAIVAPLGDLSESMLKRDLGLKDMGTVLPGHGGLLDRFDALLFCLPAAYYLARYVELGL